MRESDAAAIDELRPGRRLGWALAVIGPAAATGLGLLLQPVLDLQVLPPFVLAVVAAALAGGIGPGILALVLSAAAVNYWFFPGPAPIRFGFTTQDDLVRQLVFWSSCLFAAGLCARSRALRLRAAEVARAAHDRAARVGMERAAEVRAEVERIEAAWIPAAQELTGFPPAAPEPSVAETAPETSVAEEEPRERRERPTVLVADADAPARQLACHALEAKGYRWLSACDGTEALELIDRYDFPIDVALVEAVLPDMSGPALSDRIAARYPAATVIYLSASTSEELERQGVLRSGELLINKPFTAEQLVETVRMVDGRRVEGRGGDALAVSGESR